MAYEYRQKAEMWDELAEIWARIEPLGHRSAECRDKAANLRKLASVI
jgi:hypothetical protein